MLVRLLGIICWLMAYAAMSSYLNTRLRLVRQLAKYRGLLYLFTPLFVVVILLVFRYLLWVVGKLCEVARRPMAPNMLVVAPSKSGGLALAAMASPSTAEQGEEVVDLTVTG